MPDPRPSSGPRADDPVRGPDPLPALLTADELAAILRVDRSTVYRWAAARAIPHLAVNGAVRFDPEAIRTWLASSAVEACADPASDAAAPIPLVSKGRPGRVGRQGPVVPAAWDEAAWAETVRPTARRRRRTKKASE